jgi:hypothetical protein
MVGSGSALNLEYKSHGTMVCVPPSPITPVLQGPGGPVVVHWGRVGDTCSIYLCVVSLKNLQRGKPLLGSGRFFFSICLSPSKDTPPRRKNRRQSPGPCECKRPLVCLNLPGEHDPRIPLGVALGKALRFFFLFFASRCACVLSKWTKSYPFFEFPISREES